MKPNKEVALPVVKRLPRYYRFFTALEQEGREHVSSRELASMMGLTASQIRQDFNAFDLAGQQGFGYDIAHIREGLARILRFSERKKVILLGAGNLGRAIAEHMDFEGKGFELAAIFETAAALTRAGADAAARAVPGAIHNEAAWEKRIPVFMDYLLGE